MLPPPTRHSTQAGDHSSPGTQTHPYGSVVIQRPWWNGIQPQLNVDCHVQPYCV